MSLWTFILYDNNHCTLHMCEWFRWEYFCSENETQPQQQQQQQPFLHFEWNLILPFFTYTISFQFSRYIRTNWLNNNLNYGRHIARHLACFWKTKTKWKRQEYSEIYKGKKIIYLFCILPKLSKHSKMICELMNWIKIWALILFWSKCWNMHIYIYIYFIYRMPQFKATKI